jgi:hypothetical protein
MLDLQRICNQLGYPVHDERKASRTEAEEAPAFDFDTGRTKRMNGPVKK